MRNKYRNGQILIQVLRNCIYELLVLSLELTSREAYHHTRSILISVGDYLQSLWKTLRDSHSDKTKRIPQCPIEVVHGTDEPGPVLLTSGGTFFLAQRVFVPSEMNSIAKTIRLIGTRIDDFREAEIH